MENRIFGYCLYAVTALGVASAMPAQAQSYPANPVTITVPYGPGGNGDLAARAMSSVIQKYKEFTQPIVVINKSGAGGITGSHLVANASPDGYNLLLARVGSQVVAPALDPITPYKWDNFTFIGLLETDPYACVVAKNSPYKSIQDLLAALKAKPGKLSYATSGNMDASVVFPVKMLLDLGMKPDSALKVPYKSGAETVTAVLGGQADFACNGLSPYLGSILGGNLRALVVSTPNRVAQLPDVPTVQEIGMKDLEMVSGWSALVGPAHLPKEVTEKWEAVLTRLKKDPQWIDQVKRRGSEPSILNSEETRRFVENQYNDYRALREYLRVGN